MPPTIAIALTPPTSPAAQAVVRAYFTDIVGRYHGRDATEAEVDAALAEIGMAELAPPSGLFWLARDGEQVLGCMGLRFEPAGVGVVTRVWTAPAARRRGVASALLAAMEAAAREHGLTRLQLDTRHDLVEARAMYARHGFAEVPAFNDDPYAEHWFAKPLSRSTY